MLTNLEKRMDARKEYYKTLYKITQWIIGLTIGELALIVNLKLYSNKCFFIPILIFSVISIILSLTIMYFVITFSDVMMYSAHIRTVNQNIGEDEYDKEITKRMGTIGNILSEIVMKYKIYNF
ncbi:MAG: hypothetical protein AB1633_06380, partial [Elusimicrobiota bacterium]